MSVNHKISDICNSNIEKVISIGDNTILLDCDPSLSELKLLKPNMGTL